MMPGTTSTLGVVLQGCVCFQAPDTLSLPLNGRYHDGHTRCRPDGSCYGFLLAVYSMSASQCSFFEEYQLNDDPPVTVFTAETATGYGHMTLCRSLEVYGTVLTYTTCAVTREWLLRHTHERLMSYHQERGAGSLPAAVQAAIPTMGVLSRWSNAARGYGAGWHSWRRGGAGDPSSSNVPRLAHQPWPGTPLFVANEAFGVRHGWAESSLVMAENVVMTGWSVGRPSWLPQSSYSRIIF